MLERPPLRALLASTLAASVLTLVACGGGSGNSADDHDDTHLDTAGRLAMIDGSSTSVRIYDLDSASLAGSHALPDVPSALHASPGSRYAVVIQRLQDVAHFVDGGIWQEDHGDHLHDYKQAPRLLGFQLTGARPTHYEAHDGAAALFMDGAADTARNAEVVLLTDDGIGRSRVDARLPLPVPMHGTAEPRGNHLLATHRAADAAGTLPSHVDLYRRNGSGYDFVRRFDVECPGLHGSYSNRHHSAFGCTDGVLVITQNGEDFTARKIANPADIGAGVRIGTLAGHPSVERFIGIASPGHLFEVDPAAGTITRIDWAEGRTRRAHRFDAEGANFLVLDDEGTLHVLDAAHGWAKRASLAAVPTMPADAPFPSIAASGADDLAFVSDPLGRQVAVIELDQPRVARRISLDFSPTGLVWLGIESHDHE